MMTQDVGLVVWNETFTEPDFGQSGLASTSTASTVRYIKVSRRQNIRYSAAPKLMSIPRAWRVASSNLIVVFTGGSAFQEWASYDWLIARAIAKLALDGGRGAAPML